MFQDSTLEEYLNQNATISSKALVVAEWNMNDPDNMEVIGNYRYRRHEATYASLISSFDKFDAGNWWTNATNSDTEIFGPYDDADEPVLFSTPDEKMKRLYSLDECLKPHRPRSGINYLMFFPQSKYVGGVGKNVATDKNNSSVNRPRYYLSDPSNQFKYWSSFRKESGVERGISFPNPNSSSSYSINDSVPFVVYKQSVPTNKIVVKMQTNVGTEDLGDISTPSGRIPDPLYGFSHSTTPRWWDIEVLKNNVWTRVKRFTQNATRSDGSPIVGPDGYVELTYGLIIPPGYSGPHRFMGTVVNSSLLPDRAYQGDYFYVVSNEGDKGSVYLWNEGDWVVLADAQYGWSLNETEDLGKNLLSDLVNPPSFVQQGVTIYREFEYIRGVRIVVHTMNTLGTPFELIEMSPRLQVDLTDVVESLKVTKSTGKVDDNALPVGGLQAGTGSVKIFDYNDAFRPTNTGSIISNYLQNNITFSIWDIVEEGNQNYYIPIKKLHSEGKAPAYSEVCGVEFELRDSFYILENEPAPAILIQNTSLSYAISVLLDSIGFTNYVFLNEAGSPEPVIPYFFVGPDQNTAEVLQKLATATQSAMYFDEYNNFVVAYKDYVFSKTRTPDFVLDGDSSPGLNVAGTQPNLADLSSAEKKVYNAGTINYTERYIQRSIGSLTQANFVNADQSWIYLPALLWEVAGGQSTRTVNDKVQDQSSYALAAMSLASDLSATVPNVSGRKIQNNMLDVGDNIYWLPRYNGYLYAGGEIIKYDAVQYSVQGSGIFWIKDNDEYQKYFSTLPFNGKMFPTGLIRIMAEPYYETIDGVTYLKNGRVAKHGRGQFGTSPVAHFAGLPAHWSSNSSVRGVRMDSRYLFDPVDPPATIVGPAGWSSANNVLAASSTRTSVIKNFLRDTNVVPSKMPMIQASALSFTGPAIQPDFIPRDWLFYVYKQLTTPNGTGSDYKHFGTRMRVIGKMEAAADVDQSPVGSTTFYSYNNGEAIVLNGGAGGLAIGVNPSTNVGYYLELVALTSTNLEDISGSDDEVGAHNIIFYKVAKDSTGAEKAVPIKLWGGLTNILVDSGTFAGQQRSVGDEQTTVYDISIEYEDFASFRRFYIFLNGSQVATVDDDRPLPFYDNMALFVRGSSQVMFENVYALRQSLAQNKTGQILSPNAVNKVFGVDKVSALSYEKYGISGIVRNTYLDGLSASGEPACTMYYEEFGTIMRECAYFNIKYDRAYPALTSQISPAINSVPGFKVSGYHGGSYGAQFLVFNTMDKTITLDETSGSYLRIQGVTFTQNTTHEFTMDDYYNEVGDLADPQITPIDNTILRPPRTEADKFKTLKISRMKYGKSEWSLDSDYIQTQTAATNLMGWLADKTTRPRRLVGAEMFYNPTVQIGDLATISYSRNGVDQVADSTTTFLVYNIEYSRDSNGPTTTIYLSEV